MQKKYVRISIALGLFFTALVLFNIAKSALMAYFISHYTPPPISVSSTHAIKVDWQPYLSSVGNFVATKGVDVNAEAAGNVIQVHFESGQSVEAGAPLIDIDDSVEQADLKFIQAEWELRNLNYKRQLELLKHNATSGSSLDQAKEELDQAVAKSEKTKALIQQKHITAPFAGQLGIRQVNLGQYITPGQTTIVTLQSLDPLYIRFYVPEQRYKQIHLNQKVLVQLEEYPKIRFVSKITAINAKSDPNTHNIEVQATLPNCPAEVVKNPSAFPWIQIEKDKRDKNLFLVSCNTEANQAHHIQKLIFLPGMFTSVFVELPVLKDMIILPNTAISYSLYGNAVYLIEKDPNHPDQLYVRREFVTIGDQEGNEVIITAGLKAGQHVVSAGELKLQNGTPVVIQNDVKLNEKINTEQLGQ